VGPIGLDHEQPREPAPQQLVVEAVPIDDHVREPAVIDVTRLDITFEANGPPGEPRRRVGRGLGAEALDALRGVMRLRGGESRLTPPTLKPATSAV
jgi:hypothetical protein